MNPYNILFIKIPGKNISKPNFYDQPATNYQYLQPLVNFNHIKHAYYLKT